MCPCCTLYHPSFSVRSLLTYLSAASAIHLTPFSTFLPGLSSDWYVTLSAPCLKPPPALSTGKSINELQTWSYFCYFSLLQSSPFFLKHNSSFTMSGLPQEEMVLSSLGFSHTWDQALQFFLLTPVSPTKLSSSRVGNLYYLSLYTYYLPQRRVSINVYWLHKFCYLYSHITNPRIATLPQKKSP